MVTKKELAHKIVDWENYMKMQEYADDRYYTNGRRQEHLNYLNEMQRKLKELEEQ